MMCSYKGHLEIKHFDDDEEEDLSDDEVFTQSNKTVLLDENGVNKPLMAPRQRTKDGLQTKVRKVPPIRVIWAPTLYFLITLSTIIGIICLVVFLINVFMRNMTKASDLNIRSEKKYIPCDQITKEDIWIKTFPKLTTETAFRLNDINSDGIEDIIFGFGTGADAFYYPPVVCHVYFPDANGSCGGGILALNGKTGSEIWRHYTPHEIFALNCNVDLDGDDVKDCVGGGRMANFRAVSGKNGKLLWNFDDTYAKIETSNVYTPQYVSDIDDDNVPDLVVIHGGDPMKEPGSKTRLIGRLMIVSGKTGQILRWSQVPDDKESYYSPQVLTRPDGSQMILFGTGGETHGGSLWCIKLEHLARGDIKKARKIYTDDKKGIMTPPVLVDITADGILDIVMAMFNSTVIAFNGLTFARIWAYYQQSSESYSTPGVGYFNNDSVPDFIINYQSGPGFPIYYYTQTTILDGRNGLPLLRKPIKMVVGTQSSPLVVSVNGQGNDIFLYWVSDCHGSKNVSQLAFDFLKGTSIHDQSRADFCKLRFKQKLFSRLYALTSHLTPPGTVLYDSDQRKTVEYSNPINYSAWGLEFLYRHPEYQEEYQRYLAKDSIPNYDYAETPESDLESRYSDYQIHGMLNEPRISDNGNAALNPPLYDQNDDYTGDDHSDPSVYSPYYVQPKYPNVGNNYYYPSDYYRNSFYSHPQYHMLHRKLLPKKTQSWPEQYVGSQVYNNDARGMIGNPTRNYYAEKRKEQIKKRAMRHSNYSQYIKKALPFSRRSRRHVGPHDGGGIQRIISTGTLAPPLKSGDQGIDIVFATFWFYPSAAQGILPEDKECIDQKMKTEEERFQPSNQFYGMDHDAYEEMVTQECLRKSGRLKNHDKSKGSDYNPFNRPMGQLTVYRLHLDCKCAGGIVKGQICTNILPFKQQSWPSYMGHYGNCVAIPRH